MALEKDLLRSIKDNCPKHCRRCNFTFISCKSKTFGCQKTQEKCPSDPLDCPVMMDLPELCRHCETLLACCFDGDAELPPDNVLSNICQEELKKYRRKLEIEQGDV